HSACRAKFSAVFVSSSSPSISVQPSAQNDDIGARFVLPSSFSELISATGVPKYRILGSIVTNFRSCIRKSSPLRIDAETGEKLLHRLSKSNPESVEVTNNEFAHTVKRVVQVFNDLHPTLQPLAQLVNLVGVDIQIDLPPELRARFAAGIEHHLAPAERQQ